MMNRIERADPQGRELFHPPAEFFNRRRASYEQRLDEKWEEVRREQQREALRQALRHEERLRWRKWGRVAVSVGIVIVIALAWAGKL